MTVSESMEYFYITFGDNDAETYAQRKFPLRATDDPMRFSEKIIAGLCEELLKKDGK